MGILMGTSEQVKGPGRASVHVPAGREVYWPLGDLLGFSDDLQHAASMTLLKQFRGWGAVVGVQASGAGLDPRSHQERSCKRAEDLLEETETEHVVTQRWRSEPQPRLQPGCPRPHQTRPWRRRPGPGDGGRSGQRSCWRDLHAWVGGGREERERESPHSDPGV